MSRKGVVVLGGVERSSIPRSAGSWHVAYAAVTSGL